MIDTPIKYAEEFFLDKKYTIEGLPDFESNDIVDIEYAEKQLNGILSEEGIINENAGITPLKISSIHLNMKNVLSLDIAKMVKEKIKTPAPLAISILEDKNWID